MVHIIGPRRTLWEYCKDKISPQVKAALITAIVGFVVSIFPYVSYTRENARLKLDLASKSTKVQEIELELTPFRTLAVERFSKADPQALKQLADQMIALQADYSKQLQTIATLNVQLEQLRKSAAQSETMLKQMQRAIPPDKKNDLIKSLSALPKTKIEIVCAYPSAEPIHFSDELFDVFAKSGFPTSKKYDNLPPGIMGQHMQVNATTNYPSCAGDIQNALKTIEILTGAGYVDPTVPTNAIRFLIGERAP